MNKELRKRLSKFVKRELNDKLKRKLGITYDEFESLDHDEQQRLIKKIRQEKKCNRSDYVRVMIGSGADAIFVKKKRGERYMLSDGTFVRAGDTPEAARKRLEERLDNAAYSKPAAFVKKLSMRIR